MNVNNERVMLVHELNSNTCLQALKNYYIISPKTYNLVSNINHWYITQISKKTNNSNSNIIRCVSVQNSFKIQKD